MVVLTLLSDAHRQVVVCRYLLDLDEAETAVVLDWPRGTVKSRLSRALVAAMIRTSSPIGRLASHADTSRSRSSARADVTSRRMRAV